MTLASDPSARWELGPSSRPASYVHPVLGFSTHVWSVHPEPRDHGGPLVPYVLSEADARAAISGLFPETSHEALSMQLHNHFDDAPPPQPGPDPPFFRRKWDSLLSPGSACVLSLASGARVTLTAPGKSLDFTAGSPSQARIFVPLSSAVRAASRGASASVHIAVHGAGGCRWVANSPGGFRPLTSPPPYAFFCPFGLHPCGACQTPARKD